MKTSVTEKLPKRISKSKSKKERWKESGGDEQRLENLAAESIWTWSKALAKGTSSLWRHSKSTPSESSAKASSVKRKKMSATESSERQQTNLKPKEKKPNLEGQSSLCQPYPSERPDF
jgi:hypothetical protein